MCVCVCAYACVWVWCVPVCDMSEIADAHLSSHTSHSPSLPHTLTSSPSHTLTPHPHTLIHTLKTLILTPSHTPSQPHNTLHTPSNPHPHTLTHTLHTPSNPHPHTLTHTLTLTSVSSLQLTLWKHCVLYPTRSSRAPPTPGCSVCRRSSRSPITTWTGSGWSGAACGRSSEHTSTR